MTKKQSIVKYAIVSIIGGTLYYFVQKYFLLIFVIFLEKLLLREYISDIPQLVWLALGLVGFLICFKLLSTTWQEVSEEESIFSKKTLIVLLYFVLLGITTVFKKLGISVLLPR